LIAKYPYQLKFVVQTTEDLREVEEFVAAVGPVEPGRVLLMAEGRDAETLHLRAKILVPYAIERGWRLTPRWQIDLFGDTRGT
jgi:7-carboxy-7-deazaguanine synthase